MYTGAPPKPPVGVVGTVVVGIVTVPVVTIDPAFDGKVVVGVVYGTEVVGIV